MRSLPAAFQRTNSAIAGLVLVATIACGSSGDGAPPSGHGAKDTAGAGQGPPSSASTSSSTSGSASGSTISPPSSDTGSGSQTGSSSGSPSTGNGDAGQPNSGSGSGSSGGSSGSDAGTFVGTKTPGSAHAGDVTIDPSTTYQIVDGFGEADVWQGSSSTAMQTLLFDPVNGIGLNLLRIGIESTSGKSVLMGNAGIADGQACVKYAGSDCKVWAAPWSPPASMKNNGNVNGGASNDTLMTTDYDAWASLLAAFPAYYKQQSGVDLFAMSAQNEPDFNPSTYEACTYDKTQLVNFIDVLGAKLAALTPPVKVLAAEPDNWANLWGGDGYGPAIVADSAANSFVGPIATHDYGTTSAGTYARPSPPANNTHHVWETECTPGDTGPITIATMVYAAFTSGGVNAWHYWWTQAFVPNVNSPPPQVYALGNFSKFVRAGYYRIDVTGAPTPSASAPLVVAFTNKSDGSVAIVVVNGGAAQQVSFFVAGTAWPASVTPYVTTTSSKLLRAADVAVTAGRFSASLSAQSVTTFVGRP